MRESAPQRFGAAASGKSTTRGLLLTGCASLCGSPHMDRLRRGGGFGQRPGDSSPHGSRVVRLMDRYTTTGAIDERCRRNRPAPLRRLLVTSRELSCAVSSTHLQSASMWLCVCHSAVLNEAWRVCIMSLYMRLYVIRKIFCCTIQNVVCVVTCT